MLHKENRYYYLLLICCALDINVFYLVNADAVAILGISCLDLVFLLHAVLFCVSISNRVKSKGFVIRKSDLLMFFPIVMIIGSAYAGTRSYGQSFLQGIVSQREWFGCVMMFFPLSDWIEYGKINKSQIIKIVYQISAILLVVSIVQYFLSPVVKFTYSMQNERYGDARFYFSTVYPILATGFAFDKIVDNNVRANSKEFWKNVLIIVGSAFMCAVVTKGRMNTICFVIALLICLLINKASDGKKLMFFCVSILAGFLFLSSKISSDFMTVISGDTLQTNTLSVREAGRAYYLARVFSRGYSILWGYGSPNLHSEMAQRISNPFWQDVGTARFHLADNGIFSEIYIFGFIGLLWFIFLVFRCFKMAFAIYRAKGKCSYLLFMITDLLGCMTLIPAAFDVTIVMPIFLVVLTEEYRELNRSEKTQKIKVLNTKIYSGENQ